MQASSGGNSSLKRRLSRISSMAVQADKRTAEAFGIWVRNLPVVHPDALRPLNAPGQRRPLAMRSGAIDP